MKSFLLKIFKPINLLCFCFPLLMGGVGGGHLFSQDFLGYSNSNYAGVSGIDLNPATIADSRYKFDMTLVGFSFNIANNYIGLNKDGRKYLLSGDSSEFKKEKYLTERINSDRKSVFLGQQLVLPSFMITLSPKHAIALNVRERTFLNIDGIDQPLAHQLYEALGDSLNYKQRFQNERVSIDMMTWIEYGATYARVLKDDGDKFIKAGARVKFLQGLWASYVYINNFDYNFESDSTLSVYNTGVNYGHSNSFSLADNMVKYQFGSKPSFGFDLGAVYEWRPDREKFRYDMDGKTGLDMRYANKYKLRAGFSILDIGSIKFEKSTIGDFTADVQNWWIDTLKMDTSKAPMVNIDSILKSRFQQTEAIADFKMNLPTALSAQVDYNIWKNVYANFTAYYAFKFSKNKDKVHEITAFSITPRWDWKWFGVFMPLSFNAYRNLHLGLSARLGPLIIGTNNLAPFLGNRDIFSADFHFLLKIPIMYRKPKDKDKDHVSNKKDKCKDVPGTWEFAGCPDRDLDHIPDNIDECPDDPGLPEFNGCPDRDGDKIIDKNDSCPDVAGLAELNGCPDKDGDKITDKRDSCPDDAGLAEYNGCPDRDFDRIIDKNDLCPDDSGTVELFGCPDKDFDGITDKEDRCPDKPGPKENDGCPLARLHLLDKQGNIIATAIIDKEGKFNFIQLPSDELALLKLESYDVLIVNEVSVTLGKIIRVARRGVDGYFHFEQLSADENKIGKLDIPDTQIQLKKAEAEKVQKAMESLEFDFGKDAIRPSSMDGLDLLAELLQQNSEWRLKLSGHTDNVASMQFNMKLSEKRVEAVKKYLVSKKGIASDRIVLKWFGPSKPIATNDTEEGKQKNRRVEFLIIK
ncbi:MAG: OmpA family protein [Bacteroidetes bacterium]|nr:OmpA family protein [Bacteroidota bacterium]